MRFENLSFIDALYFVTVTALTIGYGDIVPKTQLGRVFTIIYSWILVSVGFYFLFKLADIRARIIKEY